MVTRTQRSSGPGLIVDFVNSLDLDPYAEAFETPASLAAWLVERGLLAAGARLREPDRLETIEVREALRELLGANNGIPADVTAAAKVIDDASCRARLTLRFGPEGAHLEPAVGGARGAVGHVLAAVLAAMTDGTWERLKACRAETCRWAFLDTAKNRSRAWCSMQSCGNREKARAFRERHAH